MYTTLILPYVFYLSIVTYFVAKVLNTICDFTVNFFVFGPLEIQSVSLINSLI